jgi:hypothetical protein
MCRTERRGPVVNTSASYSEGPRFKFQPERPAIPIEVYVGFSVHPGECLDSTLKLGHDRFLPNPFQFITIHFLPCHRHYSLVTLVTERAL